MQVGIVNDDSLAASDATQLERRKQRLRMAI